MAVTMPEIPSRKEAIRAHQASGGRIAAVLPMHTPRALLRAFGLLPVEVWGPPGRDTTLGDAHLQPYACSVVRSGLSFLLSGGLDVAGVVVVPHTCDSLQGLGSLVLDFMKSSTPVLPLYLPRDGGPAGLDFLTAELASLRAALEAWSGSRPDDGALLEAVIREEAADAALADLLAARLFVPCSDRVFYRMARSREYLPAERFTPIARAALATRVPEPVAGIRVLLSGMMPEPSELFDTLEEAGAVLAADDLACTGRRLYPAGSGNDPLRRLAGSLLGAAPGPTRGTPVAARARHLGDLAERTGSRAALFWVVKFCEPELFYHPQLRRTLEDAGLRTLVVEVDVSDPLPAAAVTRVQALLETVP